MNDMTTALALLAKSLTSAGVHDVIVRVQLPKKALQVFVNEQEGGGKFCPPPDALGAGHYTLRTAHGEIWLEDVDSFVAR